MKKMIQPEKFDYFIHIITRIKEPCLIKKESNVTVRCNSLSPGTQESSISVIPEILPVGCIVLVPKGNGKLHVGISKFNQKKEIEHGNVFNMRTGYNIAVETSVALFIVTLPELITIVRSEFVETKTIRDRNIVADLFDICSRKNGKQPVNIKFNETMRSLRYDLMQLGKKFKEATDENQLLKSRLSAITSATYRLNRKVSKLAKLW
jgi:hypothetical protein